VKLYKFQPLECLLHTVKEETRTVTQLKVNEYLNQHSYNLGTPVNEVVRTTYRKDDHFIQMANLSELEEEIKECSEMFLYNIGYKTHKPLRIISWLNVFDKNIMEQEHTHYKSIISGTYYVSSDNTENSGQFYIPDQIPQRELNHAIYNLKNDFDMRFTPIMGDMILFESWVRHGVYPNKTDTTRISIAFNIDTGDMNI